MIKIPYTLRLFKEKNYPVLLIYNFEIPKIMLKVKNHTERFVLTFDYEKM